MTEVKIPGNVTGPEAPPATPAVDPNRPAWLPEKFATPEAFAESYAALEAKQSSDAATPAAAADSSAAPADAASSEAPGTEAAAEAVTAAGLDFNALSAEYASKGELTAENMAKLDAAGISKEMVSQYAAGQAAMADAYVAEIAKDVGGKESMDLMLNWAAENMTADEITAYNGIMDSGDKAQTKIALSGLKARYDAVNGSSPKLLAGDTAAPQVLGYRSRAEMTSAMKDPRYKRDNAYRNDVAAKLAHTDWL